MILEVRVSEVIKSSLWSRFACTSMCVRVKEAMHICLADYWPLNKLWTKLFDCVQNVSLSSKHWCDWTIWSKIQTFIDFKKALNVLHSVIMSTSVCLQEKLYLYYIYVWLFLRVKEPQLMKPHRSRHRKRSLSTTASVMSSHVSLDSHGLSVICIS